MTNEIMIIERKEGKGYKEIYKSTDTETIYTRLTNELIAKKINNCTYIKSIKYRCNYDGTRTIIISYDNGTRALYTIKY